MKSVDLVQSKVVFNEIDHTYTLGDKVLQGITGILQRQLFQDKYAGVDDVVLANAADYGTVVHAMIEMADTLDEGNQDPIYLTYRQLLADNNLERLVNEYTVSDNEYYASQIDLVTADLSLIDIKTTSKLDKEYVSWQLSIYAHLFEMQNKGKYCNKLYALWLPKKGKAKLVEVQRKPTEYIESLLQCDIEGTPYLALQEDKQQQLIPIKKQQQIAEVLREFESYKQKEKELKEKLLSMMIENNVKKIDNDYFSVTKKEGSTRTSVDSKKLQVMYPEIYKEVCKTTNTNESLLIKLK